jgi:hypothetical protein
MSGGFCSNCHEEVFIAEQYGELGMKMPLIIAQRADEQICDPGRIKQAERIRRQEAKARARASDTFWSLKQAANAPLHADVGSATSSASLAATSAIVFSEVSRPFRDASMGLTSRRAS